MKVDEKIRALPWPGPFESENDRLNFRVTVAQPVVDGHRLLVVTVSRNLSHKLTPWASEATGEDFRLVCRKTKGAEDVAYITERGKGTARRDLREAIRGWRTSPDYAYPEISEKDEAALCRWLGIRPRERKEGSYNHAIDRLNTWTENAVKLAAEREKADRGEIMDGDVELCPEELPDGLTDYIHRVVLPQDDTLVYKKGNVLGTCFLCRREVKAGQGQRFRQGIHTKCPNCGKVVMAVLELGENFRADNLENVATIQLGKDGVTLFIRQWRILRPSDPDELWEDTAGCLKETARYAVRGKFTAKWQKEAKAAYCMRAWRYDMRSWERMKNVAEVYDGGYYFYLPTEWKKIVAHTSLKYIDLAGYEDRNRIKEGYGQNTIRFILDWARYPAVELLWKAGYRELVAAKVAGALTKKTRNVIRWSRTSIQAAVGFPLRLLREAAPEEWTVEMVQNTAKLWDMVKAGTITEEDAKILAGCKAELEDVREALGHATVRRVVKYINRQYDREKGSRTVGRDYRDYLRDCVTLRLDLNDKQVLFPPDLAAAHERTIAAIRYEKDKKKEEAYQAAVKKLKRMAWAKNGLLIRPAATVRELIEEGAALHHCVGGYAGMVAKGETAIFLIRDKTKPDKPFYTLELRDKAVIQCRTDHNRSYELDGRVSAFVREWLNAVVMKPVKGKAGTGRRKLSGKIKNEEAHVA